MLIFDKKPDKLRSGHLINWVSVDNFDDLDTSTRIIHSAYPRIIDKVQKYVNTVDDVSSLIGTILTTKQGALKIHNIFMMHTINGVQYSSPFAAAKGLREVFAIAELDPKGKCYIARMDDSDIWKSLCRQIKSLEARHSVVAWEWTI